MRQELQPCFILHRRPFKETSAILEVFSENQGRVTIVAKGLKRSRSPLNKALHLFTPLLLSWTGRGDLKVLVDAQVNGAIMWLQGLSLFSALYVNELLMKALILEDAHKKLYQHYEQVIFALAASDNLSKKIQTSLRTFEFQLLCELGYALDFQEETDPKHVLRIALQSALGDKIIHSRTLVRKLLLGI